MIVDLGKIRAKKERRAPVRWNEDTHKILTDAVYDELRNPDKDPTENVLHILQRKIKELLPPEEQRIIPSLQQVPFFRQTLRRKIREDLKKQEEQTKIIIELEKSPKDKMSPNEKNDIINHYTNNCPVEDLEAVLAKRKSIRSQELEDKLLTYMKEIQTQVMHTNSEIAKLTPRMRYH